MEVLLEIAKEDDLVEVKESAKGKKESRENVRSKVKEKKPKTSVSFEMTTIVGGHRLRRRAESLDTALADYDLGSTTPSPTEVMSRHARNELSQES